MNLYPVSLAYFWRRGFRWYGTFSSLCIFQTPLSGSFKKMVSADCTSLPPEGRAASEVVSSPGPSWGDGGSAGCTVPGRACDPDDSEHLSLCGCVRQERDPGRAPAQGAHQHFQEAQDALAHCLPAGPVRARRRESQGRA